MKKLILCLYIISAASFTFAQSGQGKFDSDRLFTGGGVGLQLGTVTLIDISPHIGYFFTDKIALGVGGTYQYYSIKADNYKYETDIWGARAFGRYYFMESVFAHLEYEYLNYEAALIDPLGYFTGDIERVGVDNVLIGAGYREQVFGNGWISLVVLWNVNESVYTLYQNPIIRMGIDVGL